MKGFDFLSHCNKRIGDGNNTRFWLDIWKGDRTLRDAFPRMFALESDKKISVAEKMVMPVDYSFRRPVRGGIEQQQLIDLASTMDSVSLSSSHDRWRARRDCLPTRVNLIRRGVTLESSICPLCLSCEEDVHHVLFQCDLARAVLRRVCRWWNLDWQLWSSFSDWYLWFSSIRISFKVKSLLEGVFCVAWWSIWVLRNRTIFDDNPPTRSVLFDDIVSFSFNWCHNRLPFNNKSVVKALFGVCYVLLWSNWKWRNKILHANPDELQKAKHEDIFPSVHMLSLFWLKKRSACSSLNWDNWVSKPYIA
ncbi:reverse transcriptase domain, Reverse transcriptase zinc-binding domain protein [Artemisia annua]|uniref:Reverse transcriptase domain, Reverse transcriptase zinc-binding domain protein n=1 Tax=Artemisia annua TaxID=35608 RepID=A0A2U1PNQ1_ARTAN|nr:reverse transcriptase domain, Reverse transcriptase zinc-binding domain protein [Artemisia annua]